MPRLSCERWCIEVSNPLAKAERSAAKDLRQGIKEQRPLKPKARKKVDLPVSLYRLLGSGWFRWGRYRTREDAQKVVDKDNRTGVCHPATGGHWMKNNWRIEGP